jgi:hypothetical protein
MSQATDLLNSLTDDQISAYSSNAGEEPHIVIGDDRFIKVPESLKRIAVQYDHNVETVTFDCPRYWDDLDMSEMIVYINCMLPNKEKVAYIAENIAADGDIMHFTWTISSGVTKNQGRIAFLVCIKKTGTNADGDPIEINHWNSELCTDCYISEGIECDVTLDMEYPDIVTQLLERMTEVEKAEGSIKELLADVEIAKSDAQVAASEAASNATVSLEAKDEVLEASAEIRNSYANAIKGNIKGEIIKVDDVSPLEHDVKCVVHGKNLFDISKIPTTTASVSSAHVTEVGDDYVIISTLEGYTGNGYCTVPVKVRDACPSMQVGKTYILSAKTESDSSNIYLPGLQKSWAFHTSMVATEELLNSTMTLYGYSMGSGLGPGNCRISNIQIEEGTVATEYEPYIDPTSVSVIASGKNFWHSKNLSYPRTVSGVTINYDPETQIYTFSGTSTSPGDIYVAPNNTHIMNINPGETWTLKVEVMGGTVDGAATSSGKMSPLVNTSDYKNTIHANNESLYATKTYTEPADVTKMYFYVYAAGIVFNNFRCRVQFEMNNAPTEFEKSRGLVTAVMSDTNAEAAVKSVSPNMTIKTDTPGVTIEAEYNRDTTKMFESYVLTDASKSHIAAEIMDSVKALFGTENVASGSNSHAVGLKTTASGKNSYAEGESTQAIGGDSHAEGWATTASGSISHAEGSNTVASGAVSHAEGENTKAVGKISHAEGQLTEAIGGNSHAEGYKAKAKGAYSHAEGLATQTGENSQATHAEGYNTQATANYAHAENSNTTASGIDSHAEGRGSTASGNISHAEGFSTEATNTASHAENYDTLASGYASHAEGFGTKASGDYSHSGGEYTVASAKAQTAMGKYNTENANALLIVGNGSSDSARKNAFEVLKDGSATVQTVGTTSNAVVTKAYVDGKIAEIQTILDDIISRLGNQNE